MIELHEIEACDLPDAMSEIYEVCGMEKTVKLIEVLQGENLYLAKYETVIEAGINNVENYKEFLKVLDEGEILEISKRLGGEFIYFPLPERLLKKSRDRKIKKEFNGYNEKKLAKKYKMSVMGIRQIIGGGQKIREKRAEPNRNQVSLFDE